MPTLVDFVTPDGSPAAYRSTRPAPHQVPTIDTELLAVYNHSVGQLGLPNFGKEWGL
jgi:hypothetical protein